MTQVKVEAHGHLGGFSKEYFIPTDDEIKAREVKISIICELIGYLKPF